MEKETLIRQSKTAYNQWCEQWRAHAKEHSAFPMKSIEHFRNIGIGKAVLCVANGYSFEEEIEVIKENKDNVDILCCDKTLGHLLDNGVEPTYCVVCDANVNYEKYLKKYEGKLNNTILFINVCANPEWAKKGNWKDIYFLVNKDVIDSHLEFSKISGCKNFIAAGTNVSNAMIILLTQCDNNYRNNFFGYDKILLTGFDYSWRLDGKYYAFDGDGGGKDKYLCHIYFNAPSGKFCYTSGNLAFSQKWLNEYIRTFGLPVVQTYKDSLLQLPFMGTLSHQIKYRHKVDDADKVKKLTSELSALEKLAKKIKHELNEISNDHYFAFSQTT